MFKVDSSINVYILRRNYIIYVKDASKYSHSKYLYWTKQSESFTFLYSIKTEK